MIKFSKSTLILLSVLCTVGLILALIGGRYISSLNREITDKFNGRRWAVPAIVYARPLEIYPGMTLSPAIFEKELLLAGYRMETPVQSQGGYDRQTNTIELTTRDFVFASGPEESARVRITFEGNTIASLINIDDDSWLPYLRLDPARIGSFHPLQHEDRLILAPMDIPELLKKGLMAVEDKNFPHHYGVSPLGILRALLVNIRAGKAIQGGSTLTQQLVKNYFLNSERTLSRKAREAIMAVLLEYHYTKDEILTAYVNEIFLGQDGARAVHGFGLASQFYFRRNLQDLSVAQTATLIGMVKGPSYYDPRRHEERCLKRRQIVLNTMLADGVIRQDTYTRADTEPLSDVAPQRHGFNRFPAFLDLVRLQLRDEYKEEDLKTNGLKILTTLDPQIQWQVESGLDSTMRILDQHPDKKELEAAVLITGRDNGEIQALAGGRDPLATGFNRAINAQRPVGSLIKPAVYLSALTGGYTLASPILDSALTVNSGNQSWTPTNYDKKEHGRTALYQALAGSYNLATVRLGMDIGLEPVITTIGQLGHTKPIQPYPSLLLGALDMSPYEITAMYQTIASGGFHMPLRSISSVLAADGTLLTRYGLEVEQRFAPENIYLLTHALERVMTEGTGSRLANPSRLYVAGKTGTSDDQRDSWFAGFTANQLGVVWLGRDDNRPTHLTGSSGALKVWGNVMLPIAHQSSGSPEPPGIFWDRIDAATLMPATVFNSRSTSLPFASGTEPSTSGSRSTSPAESIEKGVRDLFDSINRIFTQEHQHGQ